MRRIANPVADVTQLREDLAARYRGLDALYGVRLYGEEGQPPWARRADALDAAETLIVNGYEIPRELRPGRIDGSFVLSVDGIELGRT